MPTGLQPFLQELLDEQRRLQTPVAEFARQHDTRMPNVPAFNPTLIPLTRPNPGEQYAFQVDLDACSGCKACVSACHSLNGLDENETWRDVGLLMGGNDASPFQQTVTTACHHCEDPACLHGCPVLAYDKDPVTGIVRHLDDQCMGCSYCVLTCPYDVPKYNPRLGIVRKCDLCHDRLTAGEAPACAQACPTQAITIVTVPVTGKSEPAPAFLPGAPDPASTHPTTRFVSRRPLPPGLRAGDGDTHRPQPAHWPLAVMLVATQASVGMLVAGAHGPAFGAALAGIAASVLHLGQPLRAWRSFLGLRRSWLSREILAFGIYLPLVGALWLGLLPAALTGLAVGMGLLGIVCSVMIYAVTPRRQWALRWTALRFAGTVTLCGLATAWALSRGASDPPAVALIAATVALLAMEGIRGRESRQRRLQAGPLRRARRSRILFALLGGIGLPASAWLDAATAPGCSALAGVMILVAELYERHLFFRTVDVSKMPGMPSE